MSLKINLSLIGLQKKIGFRGSLENFGFNDWLEYNGKNVVFSLSSHGAELKIKTNYKEAWEEVKSIHDSLLLKDPEMANELLNAFMETEPNPEDYTDPGIFGHHLQKELPGLSPLFDEERREAAIKEGKEKLAEQLVNYFENFNKKAGLIFKKSPFSEFADEMKEIYPESIVSEAKELAYKMLKEKDGRKAEEFKKQFDAERRNENRKKMILGLGVLGLTLAAGLGAWYFSQDRQPPEVKKTEYKPRVNKGENQDFSAFVNEKNPVQTASLRLNGSSIDVPLFQDFKNGSLLYRTSFDPASISTREGKLIGEFVVKDKSGNEAKSSVNFLANLEAPNIKDLKVEKLEPGKYRVSAEIEEENLKEAYLQLLNSTKIPLVKTDSRYAANVSTKSDLEFTLNAVDAYNLSSSLAGKIKITDRDLFENWLPSEFDKALALSLFDSSQLLREIFKNDKTLSQNILSLAELNSSNIPKNLAYIVLDQIERDSRVEKNNKINLTREVIPLYLSFGNEIQRLSQIYTFNNATYYFGSSEKLINEIGKNALSLSVEKLRENDGINWDFENARKHANLLRLAKHVENILKYPKEWREGTIQVDDLGYKVGIANQNETKFWNVVEKAVKYIVDKLDSGEAEYELNIPDKKIEAWYRRQRLLPIDLFEIDIVNGYSTHFGGPIKPDWMVRDGKPSLEVGWRNVTPDSRIGGKTPQQWLEDMAKKDFREKNERYLLAIDEAVTGHPAFKEWINSDSAYKKLFGNLVEKDHVVISFDGLMKEDEVAVFIQGYPRALSRRFIPWNIEQEVPMEEPTCPRYSVLVARVFGRAAFVLTDKYPNSIGSHSEPYVIISPQLHEKISQYGKTTLPYMFGWWQYAEPLIKDHIEGKNPLELMIRKPDGELERINL